MTLGTDKINTDLISSIGRIKYSKKPSIRVVLDIDPELARFYRSLVPKHISHQKPKYKPHITIVRTGIETITKWDSWGLYDGAEIEFSYDPCVQIGRKYIFLDVYSNKLGEIREALGLPRFRIPHQSVKTTKQCYHVTIANFKFG